MSQLSKDQILGIKPLPPFPFKTAQGEVFLKRFTAADVAEWRSYAASQVVDGKIAYPAMFRCKLAQLTLCNEKGELLFEGDHVAHLTACAGEFIEEIFVASTRLNKLSEDATEAARTDFFGDQKN